LKLFSHDFGKEVIGFIETPLFQLQIGLGGFPMETKFQDVFKQYNFKIYNTYRTRGAHIIETNEGSKLFKRLECSVNNVEFEDKIQQLLIKRSHPYIDLYVRNSNNEIITTDSLGNKYVIKNWPGGTECDLKKKEDVISGITNLSSIHKLLRGVPLKEVKSSNIEGNLNTIFDKRIRELRSVRSYIRRKRKKNEFELCFLESYDHLYNQAIAASKLLKESEYETLLENSISNGHVCHGNYTYHNLTFLDKKQKQNYYELVYKQKRKVGGYEKNISNNKQVFTSNFDRALVGVQINDLYHFIRKTMEKNNWNIDLGNKMIESYNDNCPISKGEARLLYILLLFPEKFWKISNYYYNGKKTWVPRRTIEKLEDVNSQIRNKDLFLDQLIDKINNA